MEWTWEDWEVSVIGWPSRDFENYPSEIFRSVMYLD